MSERYEVHGSLWLLAGATTGERNYVKTFTNFYHARRHYKKLKRLLDKQKRTKGFVEVSKEEDKFFNNDYDNIAYCVWKLDGIKKVEETWYYFDN